MMKTSTSQTSVVHKVVDLLLLFDETSPTFSIENISVALEIPKSTVYRYVRLLCERGLLEKARDGRYGVGMALTRLGRASLNSNRQLRLIALPSMTRLAEKTRESVSLMRLFDNRVICIENIEGQHALRVMIEPGRSHLLHSGASAKVVLAHLPEADWKSRLELPLKQFTATTFTDIDTLAQELRQIRERGYAVSNGEIDVGARAVAVPIRNPESEVIAALSVEGPASRMTDECIAQYLQVLQQEASVIHEQWTWSNE